MRRPEEALQRSIVCYLKTACPDLLWYHVPNGGGRSKAEAGILKAMGVKPGVPDLAFILPGGQAAYIEVKPEGGYLRPEQKTWGREIAAAGGRFAVCRSLQDVAETLTEWGVVLRAKVAA